MSPFCVNTSGTPRTSRRKRVVSNLPTIAQDSRGSFLPFTVFLLGKPCESRDSRDASSMQALSQARKGIPSLEVRRLAMKGLGIA